uniref:Growth hormone releasing hormone receptor b n=1 Tax=Myripristis murdjan TaxID=586833 RepID=A0A667YE03_9TELE
MPPSCVFALLRTLGSLGMLVVGDSSLPPTERLMCFLGYIYRNCTEHGWSELYPTYEEACEFTYFSNFKQLYTAGYATSLISLISAIFVFTFHCTRNYIHINLFSSFILRASAVFIKDGVLFSDENLDHCFMSTVSHCDSLARM